MYFRPLYFILVSTSFVFAQSLAHAADFGQLGMVQGDVTVNGKPATNGLMLKTGDILDTHSGKCAVMIPGKGLVHFSPGSKTKLTEKDGVPEMDLARGQVRALIAGKDEGPKAKLRIRTATATMGVRGTEVYVAQPPERGAPAQFVTLEGVAQVDTQQGAIQLPANSSLSTGGGSTSSQPTAIAPEAAASLAHAVAPPAGEIMSADQAAQTETSGEVVAEGAEESSDSDFDSGEIAYDDVLEFDPLADGGVPWDIAVSLKKQ